MNNRLTMGFIGAAAPIGATIVSHLPEISLGLQCLSWAISVAIGLITLRHMTKKKDDE